ncbi:MAG: OB-fold nucleic acid binding domain-containing protein [Nanoarchaeota archaeon]|nr:OB-fold nucleic acid binding domain-containing protein [Nanoarchaeota archaeon]
MNEKLLWKVSSITMIIGLVMMYGYAGKIEVHPDLDLETMPLDTEITVRGEITSVRTHEKAIFLEIAGEKVETVDVVLFHDQDLFVEEGDYIEINGKVEEYNGKKEIIAEKVIMK